MLAPLLEGTSSVVQPCTFLLLVPILAVVVAAGARWSHVGAALVAGVVGGWSLAGGWWFLDGVALRVSGVAVAAAVVALVWWQPQSDRRARGLDSNVATGAVVAAVTLVAGAWWRPCVGDELGTILTASRTGVAGQLLPMTAYMLGVLLPVVAIGAIRELTAARDRSWRLAGVGAALVTAAIGAALVVGRHDDVVVALTNWTQS